MFSIPKRNSTSNLGLPSKCYGWNPEKKIKLSNKTMVLHLKGVKLETLRLNEGYRFLRASISGIFGLNRIFKHPSVFVINLKPPRRILNTFI